jgi:tripartite-type tricarboxylate transporter receptor subunit TctC
MYRLSSTLLRSITAACAIGIAPHAASQAYPDRPVRAIVPFPAGGAADIVARHVAQKLTEALGVQIIVDNRAGAGGAIGAEFVARAAPDGYTLLLASSSAMSINPHIMVKPTYDALRSFAPIAIIGYSPNVLVVHPSVPARTVKELIAVARARPDSLSYASNGAGTLSHLTGELFAQRAGVKLLHVPYKGAAPAVIDTMAGQVSMLFAAYPSIAGQWRAGKLRAMAVTSAKRVSAAHELPTIAEAALPGFESTQWWGAYGPAGLPASVVSRLNAEINKILRTDDIKKRFAPDAVEPAGGTPEDLARYLREDYERWGKVIRAAGIRNQ